MKEPFEKHDPSPVAVRFREARIKNGLSQKQVADRLKLQRLTIIRYENGRTASIRQRKESALAAAVETDEAWLVTGFHKQAIPVSQFPTSGIPVEGEKRNV